MTARTRTHRWRTAICRGLLATSLAISTVACSDDDEPDIENPEIDDDIEDEVEDEIQDEVDENL